MISTSPPNGNAVPAGSQVVLFVSTGPKKVQVPDVKARRGEPGQSLLKAAGFLVNQQTGQQLDRSRPDTVVKQYAVPRQDGQRWAPR